MALWDMDDCPIPDGLDALAGFEGGVDITAFGDFCETETSKDLSRARIKIFHCPRRLAMITDQTFC
ncbi:hypothetical protein YC2023_044229 [Brassica napus]